MLLELELVRRDGHGVAVVDDEPGAGGALVDGRHVHLLPFPRHDPSRRRSEAGRRSAVEVGSSGRRVWREDPRRRQTNRWQLGAGPRGGGESESLLARDGSDWERDGEKVGGEVNGRRAVYTALAYPLRASRSPLAPRRDLVGRDGILGVRAPKKAGIFFEIVSPAWGC